MAQPAFVPQSPNTAGSYSSPQYVPRPWRPERPGDIAGEGNPRLLGFGNQGPDQGYALKLAERYKDKLELKEGERESDVLAGCVRLALKRASIMGRAPIVEDLEVSFLAFGFLSDGFSSSGGVPEGLVEFRRGLLNGIAHNAGELQSKMPGAISDEVLKLKPPAIMKLQQSGWKLIFGGPPTEDG